jgi:hypothetical protein
VLLCYDPAARHWRANTLADVYRAEAQEILKELRLLSPRSFLEVRNIVAGALFPLDAAAPRVEPSGRDRVWMAAEEIWHAWAAYGLED